MSVPTPKDTQRALREAMNFFWARMYSNLEYVNAMTMSVAIRAQSTIELEKELYNYLSRYEIPVFRIHDTRLFIFSTADMDKDSFHYGSGAVYGDATQTYGQVDIDPDRPRFPIGDFTPPYLSSSILSPSNVLTLGTDYTVEDGWITFRDSPLRDPNLVKTVIYDGVTEAETFTYWAFRSEEDHNDLCDFFGTVAGVCGYSSEDLKKAINIAWDLRVNGASLTMLHRTFSLLADVDHVHTEGVVQSIYSEGDRVCVLTDNNVYTAPYGTSVLAVAGQTIYPNFNLFSSFQMKLGTEVLSAEFLPGLTLDNGHIYLGSGGGMYFTNELVPITTYKPEGWYGLERDGSNFIVRNRNGNILDVVPESLATSLIDSSPGLYYRFEVGGHVQDIQEFFERLNIPDAEGKTFFDRLADKYGRVPESISPFEEMRDFYLQANSIFIKIETQLFEDNVTAQLLNVVKAVIPAGSTFFLTRQLPYVDETYEAQVEETVEVFYINDVSEDDVTTRNECLSPVGYV